MSDADRWQRVEDLFSRAADLPAPDRAAFLDAECRTADGIPDPVLRAEVEALLAHDVQARAFFDDANARLASVADGIGAERDPAPERVGPWRLVREIGRGGMGTVHLAERADGRFEQTAALKLVRAGQAPGILARFRAERQILARLDHPGIARLLDGGLTDDDRPYLVMEYVDGAPITDYCDRHRLSVDARLGLFRQVCDAVQFAHRQLVVHRDLKPSNILVSEDASGAPRVKLLDFGIAKLLAGDAGVSLVETAEDVRVMTPEYAAPEQVRGEPVTTATDVYALGVLLYELLTGARPYSLPSRARHAVERAILEADPTVPSTAVTDASAAQARASEPTRLRRKLRGDLDQIVLRALRKEPERRYDGAAALSADLKRHLDGLPVEARPESVSYRVGKFVRRNRATVAAAALVLLAVVGGAGVALWQAAEARAERDRAEDVSAFLVGLFESPDPYAPADTSAGQDITIQTYLALGAERVRSELADRPRTQATLLASIADVYHHLDRADDEAPLRDEVVALTRRVYGPGSPEHAAALARKASVLDRLGRYDEARPLFEESLALTRAAHRPGDAAVALAEVNTGRFLRDEGEYGAADSLMRTAIGAYRKLPGVDLAELAAALDMHGGVLRELGRADDAWDLTMESYEILRGLHGDRNPETATSMGHLALTASLQERHDVADTWYRRAHDVMEATLGPDHGETVRVRTSWAAAVGKAGEFARAEALHRDNLRVLEQRYGPVHREVGTTVQNLATVVNDQERYDEGARLNRRAFEIFRATLGRDDPTAAFPLISLAWVHLQRGAPAEAERTANEALRILRPALPADHPAVQAVTQTLGEAQLAQSRAAAAEATLLPVYRQRREALGPDAERTREVAGVLAEAYQALGRTADAERFTRAASP